MKGPALLDKAPIDSYPAHGKGSLWEGQENCCCKVLIGSELVVESSRDHCKWTTFIIVVQKVQWVLVKF